jgi:hypothetical protein
MTVTFGIGNSELNASEKTANDSGIFSSESFGCCAGKKWQSFAASFKWHVEGIMHVRLVKHETPPLALDCLG